MKKPKRPMGVPRRGEVGLCVGCGYVGTERQVEEHARSCEKYAALWEKDPALALDPAEAYRYANEYRIATDPAAPLKVADAYRYLMQQEEP